MTNDNFGLSRRKVLGAMGVIGGGAALGGAGTMAFFSDEENFANNQLQAGSLDMKAAYSAHYSDWSPDEGDGVEVRMWDGPAGTTGTADDLESGETGLPANDAWLVAVDDPDKFLANTQTGADGDASCQDGTDADDLDQPVIDLDDVKPGDFGEVTFDFALCDNPGYVWLTGALRSAAENGLTEPEEKDDDEEAGVVELLDVVQAAYWIDDGNNYQNGDEEPAAVGSLREVLDALSSGTGVRLEGDIDAEEGGGSEGRCFSADTKHSVAFAWWVPVDHGNEIQTDSASFDLGFYTEQCRHNDGSGLQAGSQSVTLTSDATGGIRETDNWITATVDPGPTTTVTVELDGEVYGGGDSGLGEWPNNADTYFMEVNIDVDNDGLQEAANTDDFRFGYAAANSGARANAITNSSTASGNGGYLRRNTGGSNAGDSASRTDIAEEDISGFSASESSNQLTYTFEIDWAAVAGDGDVPSLGGAPTQIVVNEVFGGDGGEGVGATPNSSNDGRGDVDNVTDASGVLDI